MCETNGHLSDMVGQKCVYPFQTEINQRFQGVQQDIQGVQLGIQGVQQEMIGLKTELQGLRTDIKVTLVQSLY